MGASVDEAAGREILLARRFFFVEITHLPDLTK